MKFTGLGTDRPRLKLRIMSDDDLWWLFPNHREECLQDFWGEVETRKAAGMLSKSSPFWAMGDPVRYRHLPRQRGRFYQEGTPSQEGDRHERMQQH